MSKIDSSLPDWADWHVVTSIKQGTTDSFQSPVLEVATKGGEYRLSAPLGLQSSILEQGRELAGHLMALIDPSASQVAHRTYGGMPEFGFGEDR